MLAASAPASEPRPRIPLRHVVAVFIGNGLEFYDFLTFSYFAVYISRTFFPPGNPSAALLATLATFGAGFLTRPIGAIVIGGMSDRVGRKPAMIFSFTLMGIAIIGLTLTLARQLQTGRDPYRRHPQLALVVTLARFRDSSQPEQATFSAVPVV
jgi:MFS family permease